MLLGTEVGLGPGDIVLDGDPGPTKRGNPLPNFWPMSTVAKRLDASGGLGPGDIVLDGDPAPPKRAQPPIFGPCLVWPRSPISATAELLQTVAQ